MNANVTVTVGESTEIALGEAEVEVPTIESHMAADVPTEDEDLSATRGGDSSKEAKVVKHVDPMATGTEKKKVTSKAALSSSKPPPPPAAKMDKTEGAESKPKTVAAVAVVVADSNEIELGDEEVEVPVLESKLSAGDGEGGAHNAEGKKEEQEEGSDAEAAQQESKTEEETEKEEPKTISAKMPAPPSGRGRGPLARRVLRGAPPSGTNHASNKNHNGDAASTDAMEGEKENAAEHAQETGKEAKVVKHVDPMATGTEKKKVTSKAALSSSKPPPPPAAKMDKTEGAESKPKTVAAVAVVVADSNEIELGDEEVEVPVLESRLNDE